MMAILRESDVLIIGGGIIGLTLARELKARYPAKKILLIEKESHTGEHASGRNSGVLHAGFYYSADSLKARFCRDGNALMKQYAKARGLKLNECTKVVVAKDEGELAILHELKRRGDVNGVDVSIIDLKRLEEIEPNAKSHKEALFSPNTAVVGPAEVCASMTEELKERGVEIIASCAYLERVNDNTVRTSLGDIRADLVINCAGVYADRIARDFGFCKDYTIVPFKGIYLNYNGNDQPVKTCVYSVPNLKNPFLGVHFGMRVDGTIRIGPTAIPALWRENYHGWAGFSLRDMSEILGWEALLFLGNASFRHHAITEMPKYVRSHMAHEAAKMVKSIDESKFSSWSRPGIRAQLVNKKTKDLVQDFIVEGDKRSIHVLNAVSPAFTSSLAFARWIADTHVA